MWVGLNRKTLMLQNEKDFCQKTAFGLELQCSPRDPLPAYFAYVGLPRLPQSHGKIA
jgi:hypothetical protein